MADLFGGVTWAILGGMKFQPKISNSLILNINGEINNLDGKI